VGSIQLKFIDHLAKFQDFDKGMNNFNDFDNSNFTSMPIGEDFDTDKTVTKPSKMNDTDDGDFDYGGNDKDKDDVPF